MIRRVLLRNWRGYEKLNLDIGPGLTFVIADNGVGKTSLVNGVAWAVFGEASGVDGTVAIRTGADDATVEVDLTIGDTAFSVARTLQRTGRRRHQVRATVDGQEVTAAGLRHGLAEAASVPYEILPQLMLVPEMQLTHEGELFADVQDHLGGLLGIDHLRSAARTAHQLQADLARDMRAARELARVDEVAADAARARVEAIEAELDALDRSLRADAGRRDELTAALDTLAAWARHDEDIADYHRALDELAATAGTIGLAVDAGGDADDGDDDGTGLEPVGDAAERITREADDLRTTLAEARAEETLVRGLIDQLGSADALCPVCLQPVDGEVAEHASRTHRARLAQIETREADARRRQREVAAAAERIGAVAAVLARLRPPALPERPRPDAVAADIESELTALEDTIETRLGRRGALGEQREQAERTIADVQRSRTAAAELTRLNALTAAASSVAALATAEADARTEQCLDPISRTLASRWAEFFVGSSSRPRLAGGGNIELGQAATAIPYASFSGGEKTLASLLTRLLFVTSATRLDSMWLDEPLEHLDPANRTKVARLLAQVTTAGDRLGQVLVTTYEEGLARSMIERHEAASIVYVSTDDLL